MSLPELPVYYDMPYTTKEGKLTTESALYNDNLWQTLNEMVRQANNGWQFPQKTGAEITAYGTDETVPNGTTWFDTDAAKLKVKTAASTIETITSA
jgi:hypothetical protein